MMKAIQSDLAEGLECWNQDLSHLVLGLKEDIEAARIQKPGRGIMDDLRSLVFTLREMSINVLSLDEGYLNEYDAPGDYAKVGFEVNDAVEQLEVSLQKHPGVTFAQGSKASSDNQPTTPHSPAIKIGSCRPYSSSDDLGPELAMLRRISKGNSRHEGRQFVRKLVDAFDVGAHGEHPCLVFKPLREPLWLYMRRFIVGVIPPNISKVILQMILHGLDYLYIECEIIHTGMARDQIEVLYQIE